jgi:hypothetical protein
MLGPIIAREFGPLVPSESTNPCSHIDRFRKHCEAVSTFPRECVWDGVERQILTPHGLDHELDHSGIFLSYNEPASRQVLRRASGVRVPPRSPPFLCPFRTDR